MLLLRILNTLGTSLLSLLALELLIVVLVGFLEPFSRAWVVLPAFLVVPLWMLVLTFTFSSSQRWKWNVSMGVLVVLSGGLIFISSGSLG